MNKLLAAALATTTLATGCGCAEAEAISEYSASAILRGENAQDR